MKDWLNKLRNIFIHNFNMHIFISMMLLSIYTSDRVDIKTLETLRGVLLSVANGVIVAIFVFFINKLLKHRNWAHKRNVLHSNVLVISAFFIGFVTPFLIYNEYSIYFFSVLVFYATIKNFKSFGKVLVRALKPDAIVKRDDFIDFGHFYTNLVLTFTIANMLLYTVYRDLGMPKPFEFQDSTALFDSLYFTIITMTTTGFGDIVPLTGVARALVVIESFTSYILLGLMIGILSKGVDLSKLE